MKRGDIYYAHLNPVVDSEQGETRPCLVVQNDVGNAHSPTIIVIPLTKQLHKNPLPPHAHNPQACGLAVDSLALVEQIRTIDRSRLGNFVGRIRSYEQATVNRAFAVSVGIVGTMSLNSGE